MSVLQSDQNICFYWSPQIFCWCNYYTIYTLCLNWIVCCQWNKWLWVLIWATTRKHHYNFWILFSYLEIDCACCFDSIAWTESLDNSGLSNCAHGDQMDETSNHHDAELQHKHTKLFSSFPHTIVHHWQRELSGSWMKCSLWVPLTIHTAAIS